MPTLGRYLGLRSYVDDAGGKGEGDFGGRINELYGPVVGATTMEKLDEIADVYAGGELKGP